MQEVVKQISEYLVKRGHSVTVATSKDPDRINDTLNGVRIKEFDISGNSVLGIRGDIKSYKHYLLNSDFDIITNFAGQQWATDLTLPLLPNIKAKKIFVPTGFSALRDLKYSDYFEKMKEWINQYDMNVFLSDTYQDIDFAKKSGVKNIIIIPNGASEREFAGNPTENIRKELGIPADQFLILHVGSHTGVKGHSEAIEIFDRAELKNATFIIVGNVFSKRCYNSCKSKELKFKINPKNFIKNKHLLVCSLTRNQTIALYKTADLFLFPSNVECSPLVLFESMASKTPFLTTDVGNAAEIIKWSQAGILLPTFIDEKGYSHANIKQSVKILENMYHNPNQRALMQEAGFHAWQERFTWDKIAQTYEELYTHLLG